MITTVKFQFGIGSRVIDCSIESDANKTYPREGVVETMTVTKTGIVYGIRSDDNRRFPAKEGALMSAMDHKRYMEDYEKHHNPKNLEPA